MAYDGGMLRAIAIELNTLCTGAKVERVLQPAAEELDLILADHGTRRRLVISAGATLPYLSLSELPRENPPTPPVFCMLMRKHLAGAKLLSCDQLGFERVLRLRFAGYDEMGYPTEKSLIAEIMGKYSNLMLVDGTDKILAVLRPVDFTTSRKRQVLVGMTYEMPPAQDKIDPLTEREEDFLARLSAAPPEKGAVSYLTSTYLGIATATAAEIVHRAAGTSDARLCDIPAPRLCATFLGWFADLKEGRVRPTLVLSESGEPIDYTYRDSTYRGTLAKSEPCASFAELLDRYFGERDRLLRIRQRGADLLRLFSQAEARLARKLAAQREELADCAHAEEYRAQADLIVANIWRLERGMTEFIATDYSSGEGVEVLVKMDSRLSPSANAQRLYKFYRKAKTAKEILAAQIAKSEGELAYLAGVKSFLDRAESEADLAEIRDELYRTGYASRMKGYAPPKSIKLRPRAYTTPSGYRLLCGRNNLQNDELTFRRAGKDDLWFHAKGLPGSHVILLCDGEEPSAEDYTAAAEIAAYYSGAADGTGQVAVDYTRVRYVKKPAGAKPGYVIYKTNYTAYVTPRLSLAEEKGS